MFSRIVFILITVFWLVMNVLLWRAEFSPHKSGGDAVPPQLVWQKVLTSPDSSSLTIIYHGKRIGFCHWITSVGEEWANITEENVPPGLPGKTRWYRLRLEGSALTPESLGRVRFDANLKIDRTRAWQEFHGRLTIRPTTWEVRSVAAEQTLTLLQDDDGTPYERVFRFSDLQNPAMLVREFAGPLAGDLLSEIGVPAKPANAPPPDLEIQWEACEDTMRIGHNQIHVYRLQTRLLDRYSVALTVSRVGELLRVELPDDLILVNDQLSAF